jgi:hypothetical protein
MVLKLEHELENGNLKLLKRGHPQACGFASSCISILTHHVLFHFKRRNIFISMILLLVAKGLVLQKM